MCVYEKGKGGLELRCSISIITLSFSGSFNKMKMSKIKKKKKKKTTPKRILTENQNKTINKNEQNIDKKQ